MASFNQQSSLVSVCWRLVILRTVMIIGLGVTIAVVHFAVGVGLPLLPLAVGVVALALLNIWVYRCLRLGHSVTPRGIFVQLLADVAVLTLLLYCTGGSANPFVSLYLLPLVIAAVVLSPGYALFMAVVSVCCYSVLMFWNMPLAVHHFRLHVLGMWCNFVLSAGLIAFFVVRMSVALRTREQELAAERERALRNDHIVALGTLAAGAAHELATPLSTIAVLTRELEPVLEAEQAADVRCLREQVDACKTTLTRLRSYGDDAPLRHPEYWPVDELVCGIVDDWRLLRPAVAVGWHWDGPTPAPAARRDASFTQMLTNLINNAANASHAGMQVLGRLDGDQLVIEILDTGSGVAAEIDALAARAGSDMAWRSGRRGMGLMLASASIERLDGCLQWVDREDGGVCTRVTLPLKSLAPA